MGRQADWLAVLINIQYLTDRRLFRSRRGRSRQTQYQPPPASSSSPRGPTLRTDAGRALGACTRLASSSSRVSSEMMGLEEGPVGEGRRGIK